LQLAVFENPKNAGTLLGQERVTPLDSKIQNLAYGNGSFLFIAKLIKERGPSLT
jgi:hypothetical protein